MKLDMRYFYDSATQIHALGELAMSQTVAMSLGMLSKDGVISLFQNVIEGIELQQAVSLRMRLIYAYELDSLDDEDLEFLSKLTDIFNSTTYQSGRALDEGLDEFYVRCLEECREYLALLDNSND